MSSEIEQLESTVIAQYLLNKTGLSQERLGRKLFPAQDDPRKKIQRWLAGGGIGPTNRARILEAHPETIWLFDLPLYVLLSDGGLRPCEVEGLIAKYEGAAIPGVHWELPVESMLNPNPGRLVFGRSNSQALAETGAVEGFVIILGLIRLQRNEALGDTVESKVKHNAAIAYHLVQAARAFPNVARHPVFSGVWPILYRRFKEFWLESSPDPTSVTLDDELMQTYITMDGEYVLWRGGYGRVPRRLELITLPPPVVLPTEYEHCLL